MRRNSDALQAPAARGPSSPAWEDHAPAPGPGRTRRSLSPYRPRARGGHPIHEGTSRPRVDPTAMLTCSSTPPPGRLSNLRNPGKPLPIAAFPDTECGIVSWVRTEIERHTRGLQLTLTENHPDSTARANSYFIVGHDDASPVCASIGIQSDPCQEDVSGFAFDLQSPFDENCTYAVCDPRPHDGPGRTGIQDCTNNNAPIPLDGVADLNLFHDFTHAQPPGLVAWQGRATDLSTSSEPAELFPTMP